jgi:hypothetical protein
VVVFLGRNALRGERCAALSLTPVMPSEQPGELTTGIGEAEIFHVVNWAGDHAHRVGTQGLGERGEKVSRRNPLAVRRCSRILVRPG